MALDINGYSSVFKSFVDFAQRKFAERETKAIADATLESAALSGRKIVAVTDAKGDSLHKWSRGLNVTIANDRTRTLFRNAVADMFGGEAKIPESVKKAMVLSDYGEGKPLTARRIMAVKAAIDDASKKKLIANLPETMSIKVGGEVFRFDKWHYERMVEATPPAECPRTLAALKKHIAARIEHGQTIIRDVRAGRGGLHAATPENVADLTLALHAAGLRHGDKLPDGSFSVADPDGRLSKWLDTSADVYLRTSSHLRAYQNLRVDGHLNRMRGIDVPEGKNGLMAGMRTVHYGTIPDLGSIDVGGDGSGPSRRLFLKPETWGVRRNPILSSTVADSLSEGMSERKTRFSDWYESTRHMLSFIETRFADPRRGGARKEHLPSGLGVRLAAVAGLLKEDRCPEAARLLVAGNPAKGGGIRMVLFNIGKILANPDNLTERGLEDINYLLSEIGKDIGDKSGRSENRLGNEIMIEAEDLP